MSEPTLDNSALIVVDVQRGFITDASTGAVPTIVDLLQRWQTAGGLTVMTQFVNAPASSYVRLIGWSALMPDDPAVEYAPDIAPLAPSATLAIRKGGYTALVPEVIDLLRSEGREHLWITGLDTESCVLATCLSAFELGFTPWLIQDACASHAGQAVHDAGLLVISRFIGSGQIVTTTDAPIQAPQQQPATA